jgi:hypothetical protein
MILHKSAKSYTFDLLIGIRHVRINDVMEFLLIGFAIIGSLIGIMLIGDAIVRAFRELAALRDSSTHA